MGRSGAFRGGQLSGVDGAGGSPSAGPSICGDALRALRTVRRRTGRCPPLANGRCRAGIAGDRPEGAHRAVGRRSEKVHLYGVVPLLPERADGVGFRARHGLGEAPVVLFVGRMNAYKGAPALMQAAPLVWKKQPDVHFVFIGPASDEEQRIFENVDARVHYLGRVDDQEKADAYAACDIFCMPSQHEILPAVYLEAWSYGKPVIGGPAPGLRELIEGHKAGIVVSQAPEVIADGLLRLLQAPEEARMLGENGRRLVHQCYTREALVDTLERVYGKLLARLNERGGK